MQGHVEWLGNLLEPCRGSVHAHPRPETADQRLATAVCGLFWQTLPWNGSRGSHHRKWRLPNHPDTLFELVKALKDAGYQWLLVQEHSVERMDGSPLPRNQCFVPNRLLARNSQGEEISITALIKTQGSDTKLVGQMQPYYRGIGLRTATYLVTLAKCHRW